MEELFNTWWFGGLGFPLMTNIVTGIWTGLVVSRFFLFHQEIQRAHERALDLLDQFRDSLIDSSEGKFEGKFRWYYLSSVVALGEHGHWGACAELGKINENTYQKLLRLWKLGNETQLVGKVTVAEGKVLLDQIGKDAGQHMRDLMSGIKTLKPEFWTIVLGRTVSHPLIQRSRQLAVMYATATEHMETGQPLIEIWQRKVKNNGK